MVMPLPVARIGQHHGPPSRAAPGFRPSPPSPASDPSHRSPAARRMSARGRPSERQNPVPPAGDRRQDAGSRSNAPQGRPPAHRQARQESPVAVHRQVKHCMGENSTPGCTTSPPTSPNPLKAARWAVSVARAAAAVGGGIWPWSSVRAPPGGGTSVPTTNKRSGLPATAVSGKRPRRGGRSRRIVQLSGLAQRSLPSSPDGSSPNPAAT